MNISIFGLGYVGCISLGCLANNGHRLVGVDVSQLKVDLINDGKPTIIEKDVDVIIKKSYNEQRISATAKAQDAVLQTDVSIVCVGTPPTMEGHLNLDYIFSTAKEIGLALRNKDSFHVVAIRSTVLPGTNERYGEIIEEVSGKKRNVDFSVVSNPEFLREGTAVMDYNNPPVTVLGGDSVRALDIMASLYEHLDAPLQRTEIRVAEIIKYVNNSYHALKISFANEVGNICKKMDIDSHEVMNLFGLDKQLNISTYYFKPGFAYGGSCLPKDLGALNTLAHDYYLNVPVLNSIGASNDLQKRHAIELIESKKKKKILILGISFKAGTDDLRYSPIVEVTQELLGKGYQIKLIDNHVELSKLVGKNRSYIMEHLPHIAQHLITDIDEGISWADMIIITNKENEYIGLDIAEDKEIIDLVRIEGYKEHPNYNGINW